MGRAELFWNLFAKNYAKSKVSDVKGYKKTLSDTRAYLDKKLTVLELGCGTGTTSLILANSAKKIVASDISKNMIKIGKSKAKKQGIKNVEFLQADVFSPKLKKNSYDVVMAHNLVHLVKDTDRLMRRIHDLLKPKGVFIQKTPCLGGSGKMKFIAFFIRILIGPITCFTLNELKQSMKQAGFTIIKEVEYAEQHPRMFLVAKK